MFSQGGRQMTECDLAPLVRPCCYAGGVTPKGSHRRRLQGLALVSDFANERKTNRNQHECCEDQPVKRGRGRSERRDGGRSIGEQAVPRIRGSLGWGGQSESRASGDNRNDFASIALHAILGPIPELFQFVNINSPPLQFEKKISRQFLGGKFDGEPRKLELVGTS